jgi:hypothetical protein
LVNRHVYRVVLISCDANAYHDFTDHRQGHYVRQDALDAAQKEYSSDPTYQKVKPNRSYVVQTSFKIVTRIQKYEKLKIRKQEWMTVRSLDYSASRISLIVSFSALQSIDQVEESASGTIPPEQG